MSHTCFVLHPFLSSKDASVRMLLPWRRQLKGSSRECFWKIITFYSLFTVFTSGLHITLIPIPLSFHYNYYFQTAIYYNNPVGFIIIVYHIHSHIAYHWH